MQAHARAQAGLGTEPWAWSRDTDFENMVVLAGNDQDLRARAGVEGLAGGQRPEPGHGQALVLAAGHRARAAPALDAAAVQLVVHVLVHREAVVFYPAIWKAHRK